jgi:hypothetical protein
MARRCPNNFVFGFADGWFAKELVIMQLPRLLRTYSRFQNSLEFATPNFELDAQSS